MAKTNEDEFFKKFDEKNLAFLYHEKKADGAQSRYNKFVSRSDKQEIGKQNK